VSILAFALYLANAALGVVAQLGKRRFGIWHHLAYAAVFAAAIAATILEFHPGLLLTLGALVMFPRARPRTPWHTGLAAVGAVGYLVALVGAP
jgi:hypothetical protein